MPERRILLVSHWYAPALHPRAFRWSAIAARWTAEGHRVDVVCSWAPGLAREETIDGVRVFRVGGGILGRLKDRLRKPPAFQATSAGKPGTPGRIPTLSGLAGWLSDSVWKRVRWPDYACLWYFPAVRAVRRLAAAGTFDAAVTVSDPFTGHLVGLRLKEEFPPTPWLADVGDPFSFQDATPVNNVRLYGRRNVAAERRVFSLADAVTVTNPAARAEYAARFPESVRKFHVVPPLLSLPPLPPGTPRLFPQDGKLRMVFVGTFYRDVRNPAFLLRLFARLLDTPLSDRLELHVFGDVNDCGGYFGELSDPAKGKVRLHGMVPRDTVARAMAEAASLVHIGNTTRYQLPSKVVEYAASGRPVVNIVQGPSDSSVAFFKGHPAVRHVLEGEEALAGKEVEELARYIAGQPAAAPGTLSRWLEPFRAEAIAAEYRRLLLGGTPRLP